MVVAPAPILTIDAAACWAEEQRRAGKSVVLTNGVFDLLHAGHASYLQAARSMGDVLIVGVNDDASTSALKGPARPLVPASERALLLSHLRTVDCVVVFPQLTADELLKRLLPHVYVKGGDYDLLSLPEAKTAQAIGAEVCFVPLLEGQSTSNLVHRIQARLSP